VGLHVLEAARFAYRARGYRTRIVDSVVDVGPAGLSLTLAGFAAGDDRCAPAARRGRRAGSPGVPNWAGRVPSFTWERTPNCSRCGRGRVGARHVRRRRDAVLSDRT